MKLQHKPLPFTDVKSEKFGPLRIPSSPRLAKRLTGR